MLGLANLLAEELRRKVPETTRIDAFWNWRSADNPVVGVIGHRDLTAFGGLKPVTERLRQSFMDLVSQRGVEGLITGYAPGADRAAVEAWTSLALPPPILVFPFSVQHGDDTWAFCTDDPSHADEATTVCEDEVRKIGIPMLPRTGSGHVNQADEVLQRSGILIAVVDGSREQQDGGTIDTLARSGSLGRKAIVLAPLPNIIPRGPS